MSVSLESHGFHVEIAMQVGVEKAVLLFNIIHWLNKNVVNQHNVHDGVSWTYNSSRAFTSQIPYIPESTVRKHLLELESDGWLVARNDLNHSKFDKTKWYSWGEKLDCYIKNKGLLQDTPSIDQIGQSIDGNERTIPDINKTNITTDITTYSIQKRNELENENGISQKSYKEYTQPHPSVTEAVKNISPSPTLMRQRAEQENSPPTPSRGPSNINVDERPYEQTPPIAPQQEMMPFLVYLIGISHEIGCELRWNNIQEHIKNAVDLWGEKIIEKEFRNYGSFIATLTNKNVDWHKFKMNKLDKIPTLQQIAASKNRNTYVNTGPQKVAAMMPKFDLDAFQFMRAMENKEEEITPENIAKLQSKLPAFPDSAMKNIIIKFLAAHTSA